MTKMDLIKMLLDRNARIIALNKAIIEENNKTIAENNKLIEDLKNEKARREN